MALELPQAYSGGMSADGAWLAYQEIGQWDPEWRNYRGRPGAAHRHCLHFHVGASDPSLARRAPHGSGLDGRPVVYYISERDWAGNVWSFDPRTGAERQLTRHADFDVKSLGAGERHAVVYEQAGYLHAMDPDAGSAAEA